jgi:hypothetical protein
MRIRVVENKPQNILPFVADDSVGDPASVYYLSPTLSDALLKFCS